MRWFAGLTSFAVIAALNTGHAAVQGSKSPAERTSGLAD